MKRLTKVCIFFVMFSLVQIQSGYSQSKEKPQLKKLSAEKSLPKKENQEKAVPSEKTSNVDVQNEETKLDIVLVLDNSGSMIKNDPKFLTKAVVTNFLKGLGKGSRLGMVIFDQKAVVAEPLTEMVGAKTKTKFLKSLDRIDYRGQFTNSPAGIERANYELKINGRKDAQKIIIFLTDGIVDTGQKSKDLDLAKWLKEDLAQESKMAGIRIFGIAFTDQADFRLIQTLALKTEGEYFRAYKAEDIQGIFKKINAVITKPPSKPEIGSSLPSKVKEGIPFPLILAGIVVLLGILALFFVFRGKSKTAETEIRPTVPSPRDEPPMPRAELIDEKNFISDQPLELGKKSIKIGRDPKNDIAIPENTVSSLHATIEYKDGYFYLEDQRSANGTSLNNSKIEENKPVRLKSGDQIKFDIYEFIFLLPDQAPAGKTILSPSQRAGTVLRPSKPQEEPSAPSEKPHPEAKEPESPAEPAEKKPEQKPQPTPAEKEGKTRLKPGMCPEHASRRATDLCPVCKNAFCTLCMTEKNGKVVCANCAKEL